MARVTGPLMSLDASGSVAGTIVFSKWKGRGYVRQLVIPSNPQTPKQISVRAMFAFLASSWKNISGGDQDTWNGQADQDKVSDFNAYMKLNQRDWGNFLYPSMANPAARVIIAGSLGTTTATGGVGQITLAGNGVDGSYWGVAIYRSTTTGFTPSFSDLVAVIYANGDNSWSYVDTPLAVDEYCYRLQGITNDGNKGTMQAQVSATVT